MKMTSYPRDRDFVHIYDFKWETFLSLESISNVVWFVCLNILLGFYSKMIKNNNLDTHRDMTAKAVNYFCDGGFQPVQYPLGRLYRAAGWVEQPQ